MVTPYREQGPVKEFTYDMPRKLTFNQLATYGIYREKLVTLSNIVSQATHNGWLGDVDKHIAMFEKMKSETCKRVHGECDHVSFINDKEKHTCTDCEQIVKSIKGLTFDNVNEMLQNERAPSQEKLMPAATIKVAHRSHALDVIIFLAIFVGSFIMYYWTRHR